MSILQSLYEQNEAIELFCFTNDVVDRLKFEKEIGDESHKKLWFLIDSDNSEGWIKKACITASFHNLPLDNETKVLDYLIQIKEKMADDRNRGIHLW